MFDTTKLSLTKMEAARRQLKAAITLWFQGGDAVAVHTLAGAAYQIIHDICVAKSAGPLLFDSPLIRDEYRKEAVNLLKHDVNFFKHADKAPDGTTDFPPATSELFMMGAIWGLQNLALERDVEEKAYFVWFTIQHPEFLTEEGLRARSQFSNRKEFDELRSLPREQFLNAVKLAWSHLKATI